MDNSNNKHTCTSCRCSKVCNFDLYTPDICDNYIPYDEPAEADVNSSDRLKPCPFCGSPAIFKAKADKSADGLESHNLFKYVIECSKCNCTPMSTPFEMNVYMNENGEVVPTSTSKMVRSKAIEVWESRTE